ncbi:MAG: ribose-phosphate diphosphokinase [Parcubacteria group bacterium]|nr:ribose-phosphate diphosphokinase [Parcubacteria group bacterium]
MQTIIVGDKLAEKLAQYLRLDVITIEERVFPDGEIKPKLKKEIKADNAVLLLQKRESENINDYLIKYFLIARKIKETVPKLIGIMPYFPYARQDAVFEDGEPISSLYLGELLSHILDVFITCNMHEHRKKISDLFRIPAYNLSLFNDLAKYFNDLNPQETIVIGPDREAKTFVDDFCQNFPAEKIILAKERNTKTGEISFSEKNFDFQNKNIIIIDDMVATGGTIFEVATMVQKAKAKTISFVFVHPVFGDASVESLLKLNPQKIVTTNTIENSKYQLDINECLNNFLKQELKI